PTLVSTVLARGFTVSMRLGSTTRSEEASAVVAVGPTCTTGSDATLVIVESVTWIAGELSVRLLAPSYVLSVCPAPRTSVAPVMETSGTSGTTGTVGTEEPDAISAVNGGMSGATVTSGNASGSVARDRRAWIAARLSSPSPVRTASRSAV